MRRRNDLIPHRGHLLLRLLGVQSSVKKLGIQFNPLRGQMVLLVVVALRLLLQPLQVPVLLKNWLHSFKKLLLCQSRDMHLNYCWTKNVLETFQDLSRLVLKNKMVSNVYKIWLLNTRLLEEIKVEDFHSLRKKIFCTPLPPAMNALTRFLEGKYFYPYVQSLIQFLFLLNGNQNKTPFWGHIWALTSS